MKKWGGIFCIIILLFAGLSITPAIGSVVEAVESEEGEKVTISFWDCTGRRPVKQELELLESDWEELKDKLNEVTKTSESFKELFNAQRDLYNNYGFNTDSKSFDILNQRANERFKNRIFRQAVKPLPENFIVNAICAISFTLDTCDTFVFGLNTFMNLVGLDIISVHRGNTSSGITTFGGLLEQTAEPGDYVGFMFGFLGYWSGTKTGTGTYSDLNCAGFTVITSWIPI
ncbi:hypothetical protein AYK21_04135 [Thermoplasmatales archaeon SG8-52-2]|nr:MAG: hypothetical protein AYK21_04135 [Thermoplasmatales archaeon SG8-52-2]